VALIQNISPLIKLNLHLSKSKRRLSLSVFLSEMAIHIEFTDDWLVTSDS
jgi:hypothetical protein